MKNITLILFSVGNTCWIGMGLEFMYLFTKGAAQYWQRRIADAPSYERWA